MFPKMWTARKFLRGATPGKGVHGPDHHHIILERRRCHAPYRISRTYSQ